MASRLNIEHSLARSIGDPKVIENSSKRVIESLSFTEANCALYACFDRCRIVL